MGRDDLQPVSAPPATPAGVDLVLGFVNTRSVLGSPDHLRDVDAMRGWAARTHLLDPATLISDSDVATAREIRGAFAVLLLAHTGIHGNDEQAIEHAETYLARAAALHPVAPLISVKSSRWTPTQPGVAGLFGTLLATVAQTASTSEWKRLKACANHACYTGFLDKTKNSSALYCSTSCSSQMTSRAYRKRHTAGTPVATATDTKP
ncbi:CGNR zinc finger domain-containing protein [Streptomyces sp. NPDC048279]|uniref:CGNR zinc finger domain-containing protein n=1 Tax=Streptomyces sp. NPDC048279 TaxID=3154714 RepID=UPI0034450FF9